MRTILFAAWMLLIPGGSLLADPAVRLHVPMASGQPGEEMALEFRADVTSPVHTLIIRFDVPPEIADYTGVEVSGTASAHAPLRGITYNPNYYFGQYHGYLLIVRFQSENDYTPLAPGSDLLIVKAMFRVHADAVVGEYPIHVEQAEFDGTAGHTLTLEVEGDGSFRVQPPSGPRPVGGLHCAQKGAEVQLSWTANGAYDAILIERDGKPLATLPGTATGYEDRPSPGPASYSVRALGGGKQSLPAGCNLLVEPERPAAITGLSCAPSGGGVSLSWTNGGDYDAIALLSHLYLGGSQPPCLDAADSDDSGHVEMTDVVVLLSHLFRGAGPLPFPGSGAAWFDPTPDDLSCGVAPR